MNDTYDAKLGKSSTFLGVTTYQQDFYCKEVIQSQQCIPLRWEIHGRSNFGSHSDYYILEFSKYNTTIDEKYFDVHALCPEITESAKSQSHPLQIILDVNSAQDNIRLINKINNNKKFGFRAAPNKFLKRGAKTLPTINRLHDPDLKECDIPEVATPKHLDWRTKGVVNFVKDQVFCGSCWTFAAAGMIESRMNVLLQKKDKSQPRVRLSE